MFLMRLSPRARLISFVASAVLFWYLFSRPRTDADLAREVLRNHEVDTAIEKAGHAIERLYWQTKRDHDGMLKRQSKSYIEERDEYRRRYQRNEPWAFSSWYHLSLSWGSKIIDDYDNIVDQLAPFQNYYAHNCDQQGYDPAFLQRWRLLRVCFRRKDLEFEGYQEEWFVAAVQFLAADFKAWAPNVCILINMGDEPRVVLPADGGSSGSGSYAHQAKEGECPTPMFEDRSHQNIWPDIQDQCTRQAETSSEKLSFNNKETMDLCEIGPDFPYGGLHSPDTMKKTQDRVPILSTGSFAPFSDVLFPSPYRITETQTYHERDDVDWYIKLPYVYWRGSTTGGYATEKLWRFHRQSLVQHLDSRSRQDANVKFTDVIQCEERACEIQNTTLPLSERQPLAKAWEYKMVLDVDGNGISGRLYDLLRSKSLVLRPSFIREWHDYGLRPWLHYVPLSSDYGEVDQVLDYFMSPEGDKVGKLIADEGRQWANDSLRYHEMKLYFIRLVLEMGRDKPPPIW